jgi:putative membrane protein
VPASLIVAGSLGLLLLVYLIVESGARDVGHALLVIGWWLLPITAYHFVPLFFSALSWRELLPRFSRPGKFTIVWIRWIRESINSLLFSVGGDLVSVRLANLRGVPGTQSAASMVVDTTIGALTQLVFVMCGLALLLLHSTERVVLVVAGTVLAAMAILCAGIGGFILFQHRGLFVRFAKLAHRIMPQAWPPALSTSASAIDEAVVAAYRSGPPILRAIMFRLIGWTAGAGEVWLAMQALGLPLGFLDAFILESLASGVRAAAFIVPGALGAQEGSFVLFGALFGLPPDTALAISLAKRVRELALGLPGLFVWHWIEAHHVLRRPPQPAPRTSLR